MTRSERLERRFRRLLRAYPADYRAERGDEIIGVLLDGAAPDQARPSVGDALDLTRAGLAARFRRRRAAGRSPWTDAFAILTVVLPILLAAGIVLQPMIQIAYRGQLSRSLPPGDLRSYSLCMLAGWKAPVAWLVVVVLLLGRKPSLAFAAAVGATALAALHLVQSPFAYQAPVIQAVDALALPVTATVLLSSAARARTGLDLVGRRGVQVAALGAVLVQLIPLAVSYAFDRIGVLAMEIGMGADLMALVTLLAIATALARRTGRDVARRVAASSFAIASVLLISLLRKWTMTNIPFHKGDLGIVLVVTALVPMALVGGARRLPRLAGIRRRSAHAA